MFNYIIDSHCHLDLIEEKGININKIIQNCNDNNVAILNNICTNIDKFSSIYKYCQNYDFIYCSLGDHPCIINQDHLPKNVDEILSYVKKYDKIIAIGETGLDYFHDQSYKELQKLSFINHIKAAAISNLPVIIHSRNCDDDMIEILRFQFKKLNFTALLHCFCGSKSMAIEAIKLGIYISISGIVTFNNAQSLQNIVKMIPLDLLLVETDSPYLAPHPYRGKINQPSYINATVDFIANIKNVSRETIISSTTRNFYKVFSKCPKKQ